MISPEGPKKSGAKIKLLKISQRSSVGRVTNAIWRGIGNQSRFAVRIIARSLQESRGIVGEHFLRTELVSATVLVESRHMPRRGFARLQRWGRLVI
jgi:hypothetical protein